MRPAGSGRRRRGAPPLDELGGVSRRTFYRWREIGKAPEGFKLPNGELRIYRSEFTAWLQSSREAA
ncbi:helix-turn-helix domain-containing protein [Nonomuraea sp. NPDC003709]|uniref:helix-turn-helix transcriptional regulator n=1 Tax=Nonomuraea sp. NPDC003709 TaxID=3154450 RepID=UPI0033AB49E8